MTLLSVNNLSQSYGDQPLLDQVNLAIEDNERICLVGRNGTGKSTFLKILCKQINPDDGVVNYSKGLIVRELKQEVPVNLKGSVYDIIADGIGELSQVIRDWHHAALESTSNPKALERMAILQEQIETNNAWTLEQRISTTISKLDLPSDAPFDSLSGGFKRRVLLAQALVAEPQLLLLDEPTNHLDIDSITWLEELLLHYHGSLLFITHDRAFLQALATRIIDLDRGQLTSWPGSYDRYLVNKQAYLEAESTSNTLFDKKLAEEEVWIRQGIKARRTRNEGRVRALQKLRTERAERRETIGRVKLEAQRAESSGKIIIEADNISFRWETDPVITHFSCKILRGDKIGIIGPNGCGKTTLINLLLKQLEPFEGRVELGTKLEIAYFDQHRNILDLEKTVRDNIADGSDNIIVNGQPKHVISHLKDFLFSSKNVNKPAKSLSGGERNRLLLAKLFTKSFNFLIMDEPTNDLDIDTLELLEELLVEFSGTLILVSHDREFINNIVSQTYAFEGSGKIIENVGGYDDWVNRQSVAPPASRAQHKSAPQKSNPKLNFEEKKELKALPRKIEKLEKQILDLHNQMGLPDFYQQNQLEIEKLQSKLNLLENSLAQFYSLWEKLEA